MNNAGTMSNIKVQKTDLIDALNINKESHIIEYEEAAKAYRELIIHDLETRLSVIKAGDEIDLTFQHPIPACHSAEYDKALRMLDMSVSNIIELTDREFTQYVMDDWTWTAGVKFANTYAMSGVQLLSQ